MSTDETIMTAEDHIREARRYAAYAEEGEGASSYERTMRRTNDLQAAQVHATLAQTLKAAELLPVMAGLADWVASGAPETPASGDDKEAGR